MLQAHSLLWYYLWVAPNVLLLCIAVVMWQRGLYKQYPAFLIFAAVTGVEQLILCFADFSPAVSPPNWWRMFWVALLVEALIRFALIGEMFSAVVGIYPCLAKLGKFLISGVGGVLVLVATAAAAYTPKDNIHWIVADAPILQQTIYIIACGLIVFLFVFAAYFQLRWNRLPFGIMLGLGISACVHLATWALAANGNFPEQDRVFLDFARMSTYHACVLIWFYYVLVPQKSPASLPLPPAGNTLELWNRELERLLHK
jgi:hypothetical protein